MSYEAYTEGLEDQYGNPISPEERERLDEQLQRDKAALNGTSLHPRQRSHPMVGTPLDDGISIADRIRASFIRGNAIFDLPPPRPLVGDLLDRETLVSFYGPSGHGKSFAGIDISASVATRSSWHGLEVAGGKVIYVAAEGAAGMGARYRAWCEHHAYDDVPDLIWRTSPLDLLDSLESLPTVDAIKAEEPVLVIFDTLARSMVGGDENSSKDMGRIVEHADRIRREAHCTVCLIHHSGMDLSRGLRGHTSLLGAMDTIVEITGGDGTVTMKVTKQKHRESGQVHRFRLVPAGMSVVLERGDQGTDLGPSMRVILQALDDIDTGEGVSASVWKKAADSLSDATFWRYRKIAHDNKFTLTLGTEKRKLYSLSLLGREAIHSLAITQLSGTLTTAAESTIYHSPPLGTGGSDSSDSRPEGEES